jgi:uncharacterized protein (TIGR03086 family)
MSRREPRSDHRSACLGFEHVVDAVDGRWDRPTPCADWDGRGVLEHVIGFHEVLLLRPLEIRAHRPKDDVPGRYKATQRAIFEAIDQPPDGRVDLDALLPALTIEMLVHAWDLGRSVDLDPALDPALCEAALQTVEKNAAAFGASGLYPPPVVTTGTAARDRMLALLGRDPAWAPPAQGTEH